MTRTFRRVSRIAPLAAAYGTLFSGDDTGSIAQDIIADVLHWCAANGGDVGRALRMAAVHFDEETIEGEAVQGIDGQDVHEALFEADDSEGMKEAFAEHRARRTAEATVSLLTLFITTG